MQQQLFTYLATPASPASDTGRLERLSVAVQPNMSVYGWPTTAGSKALAGFNAVYDATAVERLKQAGAHLKGSIRMSELGFGLAGDTGAKVLRSGQADCVLMTDTMGEARLAACMAGVFGFKPSYGLVSRFGLIGLVPSMECYGILAPNLVDIVDVSSTLMGSDPRDSSMAEVGAAFAMPKFDRGLPTDISNSACGVIKECFEMLDRAESQAFETAVSRLANGGFRIHEARLKDFDMARTVHNVIGAVEASSSAGKYDGVRYGHRTTSARHWNEMYMNTRAESFGVLVKTYLFQGAYFQYENYDAFVDAARIRNRILTQTETLFEEFDVLLLPTRRAALDPFNALNVNAVYDVFSWTLLANVTGHPALTLPGMVECGDTDLGLQLVGPRFQDARLLATAAQCMELA